jgi:hypothetical protein
VLFPDEPVTLLAEVTHNEGSAAGLVLQAKTADGAQVTFEAPFGGAQQVEGEALAVLHAMAYVGGLLSGRSHLHVKADGSRLEKQPEEEAVREEVRAPAGRGRRLLACLRLGAARLRWSSLLEARGRKLAAPSSAGCKTRPG